MSKIAASVLAADVLHLGEAAKLVESAACDYLHFDVMDGVFVPNISFGPHILDGMHRVTKVMCDTHLMLLRPFDYIDVFAQSGSDIITVHVEAEKFEECIAKIRGLGLRAGASLKPGTKAEVLKPYFKDLDLILVMTVEPGFGGQKLMIDQVDKIREFRALGYEGEIEVDGGITLENAHLLAQAGADTLVMGTSFFKAENPKELVRQMHGLS